MNIISPPHPPQIFGQGIVAARTDALNGGRAADVRFLLRSRPSQPAQFLALSVISPRATIQDPGSVGREAPEALDHGSVQAIAFSLARLPADKYSSLGLKTVFYRRHRMFQLRFVVSVFFHQLCNASGGDAREYKPVGVYDRQLVGQL